MGKVVDREPVGADTVDLSQTRGKLPLTTQDVR
jgi:hypothetical protein